MALPSIETISDSYMTSMPSSATTSSSASLNSLTPNMPGVGIDRTMRLSRPERRSLRDTPLSPSVASSAADHVLGTVNLELRNDLATYLGWVMPFDAELVLPGATPEDVAEAQLMLARIGVETPAGAATGDPQDWPAPDDRGAWPAASWGDLAAALDERDDIVVLDVRDGWEFEQGHHPRALQIPFHDVLERADEIPAGQVWISCATGTRGSVAVSLLARAGRDVVLIDDFCLPGDTPGA